MNESQRILDDTLATWNYQSTHRIEWREEWGYSVTDKLGLPMARRFEDSSVRAYDFGSNTVQDHDPSAPRVEDVAHILTFHPGTVTFQGKRITVQYGGAYCFSPDNPTHRIEKHG